MFVLYKAPVMLFVIIIDFCRSGKLFRCFYYDKVHKIIKHFNWATCSFLNFFLHAINGDTINSLPRWVGSDVLEITVLESKRAIQHIKDNSENVFTNHEEFIVKPSNEYMELINKANSDYYRTIIGMDGITNMYTSYALEFKDKNDKDTLIGKMNYEYEYIIKPIISALSNLETIVNELNTGLNPINNSLDNLIGQLNDFEQTIQDISDSISKNFINFQQIVDDIMLTLFDIFFGLFLATAIAGLTMLIIYKIKTCCGFKFIIHILWNILVICVVSSLVLGGIMGIISIICKELTPVLVYIFDPDYLVNNFGAKSKTAQAINTCLNGDGDLSLLLGAKGNHNIELVNTL